MFKVTKDILQQVYTQRPSEVKKYDYGLMLVIGGGEFYSGSPALSAFAGLKAGVDMVRVIAPKRAADIIASFSPVLAAYPLSGDHLLKAHLATLLTMTEAARDVSRGNVAVVIGGGMGRTPETQETIGEYLSQINVPCVIDADALYTVAKNPEIIAGKPFLLTPNTYEFSIITKREVRALEPEKRIPIVQEEAARLQTTIVLKVKTDIISDGKEVALNDKAGSPYLSVGGIGDTLAGIAGSYLARRTTPFVAGAAAAFINGEAGSVAAKKMKESLVATDLIDAIPSVIA